MQQPASRTPLGKKHPRDVILKRRMIHSKAFGRRARKLLRPLDVAHARKLRFIYVCLSLPRACLFDTGRQRKRTKPFGQRGRKYENCVSQYVSQVNPDALYKASNIDRSRKTSLDYSRKSVLRHE